MLDRDTFSTSWALWGDRIPFQPEHDESATIYYHYIGERLDEQEFLEASKKLFETWNEKRFPSPAEIVELVVPHQGRVDFFRLWRANKDGKEAFSAVWVTLDERSIAAGKSVGGWSRFSNARHEDMRWLLQEFLDFYDMEPRLQIAGSRRTRLAASGDFKTAFARRPNLPSEPGAPHATRLSYPLAGDDTR